ncbi:MAG TPA: polymorphic toxin-type HINT domain-containing protein, partial [Candidatus Atribacteria bacterium]|nr:polymorphic toxin-type HINT domain-containing protein [Candidatus Atribacteria bacterium]
EGQKVKTKRGEIPIEEVRPGDEVLTFNEVTGKTEWKTVVNTSRSIRRDLVEIETEKGKLLVTEDHPVFTQRGWVRAGELTDEDVLYTY